MWEFFPYKCVLEIFYVDVFNEDIFHRLANLSDCIRWWPDGRQNYIFLNYTLKEWNYITTWLNSIWRELPKARLKTYFLYQKLTFPFDLVCENIILTYSLYIRGFTMFAVNSATSMSSIHIIA